MNQSSRSCESCIFWDACSQSQGECRRHAPTAGTGYGDSDGTPAAVWPTTLAQDWCGEWCSKTAPFASEVGGPPPLRVSYEAQGTPQEPPLDPEQERALRNASIAQALMVLPDEKRDRILAEVLSDEEREAPAPPHDFYERVQDYLARQRDQSQSSANRGGD